MCMLFSMYLYSETVYSYFIGNTIMFWDLISQPRPIEESSTRGEKELKMLYSDYNKQYNHCIGKKETV